MFRITVACFTCLSLLTMCHGRSSLMDQGYSNDSPYISEQDDITHTIRVKMGTSLTLKCGRRHKNVIWEYKQCDASYQGIQCNIKREDKYSWKKLNVPSRKVKIDNSTKFNNGIYRCKQKDTVKETYVVEVVGENYDGQPPTVEPLKISNDTNQPTEFTIQCTVDSIVLPSVIWLRQCYGNQCEIDYDQNCYCHIDIQASVYRVGKKYISKMNIYNARQQDSGVYACLAITEYGKDYKTGTITVPNYLLRENYNLVLVLVVVPLILIVTPLSICLCYYCKRRQKTRTLANNATEQISRLVANTDKA